MNNENLERVKELYHKGFKCIKYENNKDGNFTVYFKNFENESIDMIFSEDKHEIESIKDFINNN